MRLFLLLTACLNSVGLVSAVEVNNCCRSSDKEIKWTTRRSRTAQEQRQVLQEEEEEMTSLLCSSQSLQDAKKDAWTFLRTHIMEFDRPKLHTLGFRGGSDTSITTNNAAPDGLDQGLIGPTIDLALKAKMEYPWTDALPQEVFYEYVLNYANLNEGRSNWRPLLWDALHPLIKQDQGSDSSSLTPNDVVRMVNKKLWSSLPTPHNNTIYFKHGLTPLIFDPFSIMVFGYASCTGLAILFVDALRAVGIAARVVGTPAWNSHPERGNHNWIEVYNIDNDKWIFLEPSANQTNVDDLTTNPCSKWFCNAALFPPKEGGGKDDNNQTSVFSARLMFSATKTYYPLAWEPECQDVPGEDRTDYYQEVCSQC